MASDQDREGRVMKPTKKIRKELEALVVQCEGTYQVADQCRQQQAEAWSMKALREAREALWKFDNGDLQYLDQNILAARGCRELALQYLR